MPTFDDVGLEQRLFARRWLARKIRVFAQCRSSNEEGRKLLEQGVDCASALLVADAQTGGRGRRQRDWWSGPKGANLAITLGYRTTELAPELFGLLGAVALAEVLSQYLGDAQRVAVKWPNDLLVDGAKIAGFLCEQPAAGKGTLLLGLGFNLALAPPPHHAPYATTCLADCLAARTPCPSRESFLGAWLWQLEHGLRTFLLQSPARFEADFLSWLQHWAPHGVRNPHSAEEGLLLEFSISRGLRWGLEPHAPFHPLGWIPSLEALSS